MRIYENKDQKRDTQCNYCFRFGHNKRYCPTMKAQWDANPQVHVTWVHNSLVDVDVSMFAPHYQNYWDDAQARRQFRAHWQYMKNRFAPKATTKTTKPRKKAKCGFCGSTAHNRRNCSKMKNFVYVLNETNKTYRSQFYDRFIEGMGIGAGALVSIRDWDGNQKVAILTDFPTDDIMFTNLTRTWSDYNTKAKCSFLVDGEKQSYNMGESFFYHEDRDEQIAMGLWGNMYCNWGRVHNVISPAPTKPTKEWFVGKAPCYEWVVKKKDQQTLMGAFYHHIKEFYPHDNLRSKLGAKVYDQYYTR